VIRRFFPKGTDLWKLTSQQGKTVNGYAILVANNSDSLQVFGINPLLQKK